MPTVAEPRPAAEAAPSVITEVISRIINNASNATQSPTAGNAPQAEPVPKWSSAIVTWDGAWTFHVYGLGVLFAVLALVTAALLLLVARRRIVATRMVTPILVFVVLMATSRSTFLLGDAYGSRMVYSPPLLQALNGLTMPCLMSAYSLLLYTTKRAFRPRSSSSRDPLLVGLAAAISCYFAFSLTADVFIGLEVPMARTLVIICNCVFIVWGLVLYVAFGSVGCHLYKQIRSSQKLTGKGAEKEIPWKRYRRPVIIIGMATACGLGVMVLYAYGLTAIYHMYNTGSVFPRAWPWWAYQTAARLLELAMASLILYATILTPSNQERMKCSVASSHKALTSRSSSSTLWAVNARSVVTITAPNSPRQGCSESGGRPCAASHAGPSSESSGISNPDHLRACNSPSVASSSTLI